MLRRIVLSFMIIWITGAHYVGSACLRFGFQPLSPSSITPNSCLSHIQVASLPAYTDIHHHLPFPLVPVEQLFILHPQLDLYSPEKIVDNSGSRVEAGGEVYITWFGAGQGAGYRGKKVGVLIV